VKNKPTKKLSEIETSWTELGLAHSDDLESEASQQARQVLLHRNATPVYQYLLACVRDENVAEDLAQDFAIRFLKGRFENADQDRGRFRDFVKRCLSNLATDHFRRKKKEQKDLRSVVPEAISTSEKDEGLRDIWRQEVLNQTWDALRNSDDSSDQIYLTVLQMKAEHPQASAAELAVMIQEALGKSELSEDWVRQNLHRARKRFGRSLRNEISQTLGHRQEEAVDEELAELQLLQYCS